MAASYSITAAAGRNVLHGMAVAPEVRPADPGLRLLLTAQVRLRNAVLDRQISAW